VTIIGGSEQISVIARESRYAARGWCQSNPLKMDVCHVNWLVSPLGTEPATGGMTAEGAGFRTELGNRVSEPSTRRSSDV
jgi:hypothetical protein